MSPSLPNLFLIGGMKCGSTTLYVDLALHEDIFAPETKEPTFLEQTDLSLSEVGKLYQKLFQHGEGHRYRMDGSTRYSMRTQSEDIPVKLAELCGTDVRVIYVVRNPFDRIASHYRHGFGTGSYTGTFAEALSGDPNLLDHTRYAWQLEPWIEVFGKPSIYVMQFEAYVENRHAAVADVETWLGLPPQVEGIESASRKNASEGKTAPAGWVSRLTQHPLYKTKVAPLIPRGLLDRAKRVTHRPLPEASVEWTESMRAGVVEPLRDDVLRITEMCQFPRATKGKCLWSEWESGKRKEEMPGKDKVAAVEE